MVYWPVLVLCVAGIWRLRAEARPHALVALLLLVFALHQVVSAAFYRLPSWRIAFVAVLLISCALALADTLLHTPAVQFLSTGQAIQHNSKEAIRIGYTCFDNSRRRSTRSSSAHSSGCWRG